jgi:hypothetical protein
VDVNLGLIDHYGPFDNVTIAFNFGFLYLDFMLIGRVGGNKCCLGSGLLASLYHGSVLPSNTDVRSLLMSP